MVYDVLFTSSLILEHFFFLYDYVLLTSLLLSFFHFSSLLLPFPFVENTLGSCVLACTIFFPIGFSGRGNAQCHRDLITITLCFGEIHTGPSLGTLGSVSCGHFGAVEWSVRSSDGAWEEMGRF